MLQIKGISLKQPFANLLLPPYNKNRNYLKRKKGRGVLASNYKL